MDQVSADIDTPGATASRRGATELFVGAVGRLFVSGIGTIIIAAFIGPSHKGTLATLAAVSWMVSVVLGVGMDGTIRYYLATRNWSVSQASSIILGSTLIATVLAFAGYEAFKLLSPKDILAGLTTAQLTIATSMNLLGRLTGPALAALRRFNFYAKLAFAAAFVNPAAFLILRATGLDPLQSALWGFLGAEAALALPGAFYLLKIGRWRFSRPNDARGAIWYGLRSLGTNLFSMANLRLDVVLLRSLSTSAATGAYSLAAQLSEVVWLVPSSVGVASFPEIAESGHNDGRWTARNSRLVTALSALAALGAGVAASALILFLMPAYRSGLSALWLLLPGTIAVSMSQILLHDLNARRLPEANTLGAAGALVVTVVGGLLLIPRMGLNGAAIVSTVAYSVNTLILSRYFVRTTSCPVRLLVPGPKDLLESLTLSVRVARELIGSRRTADAEGSKSRAGRRRLRASARRMQFALLRWSGIAALVRETVQRRRVTIINYHAVSPQVFENHLSILNKRYNIITLEQYTAAVRAGDLRSLPPKSLIITIDDGHKSVVDLSGACRRYNVQPTVFVCSGLVDTARRFWWTTPADYGEVARLKDLEHTERLRSLSACGYTETKEYPEPSSIDRAGLEQTREVFDFQAHSVFHPILTRCSAERSENEVHQSKTDLEREYDLDIWAFAYPDGAYGDRETGYVSDAGYTCALTCDAGYNDASTDLYRLKRVGMGMWEGAHEGSASVHSIVDTNEVVARASGVPALLARMMSDGN